MTKRTATYTFTEQIKNGLLTSGIRLFRSTHTAERKILNKLLQIYQCFYIHLVHSTYYFMINYQRVNIFKLGEFNNQNSKKRNCVKNSERERKNVLGSG